MKKYKIILVAVLSNILLFNNCYLTYSYSSEKLNINARNVIAMDSKTKRVLFEKNSEVITSIASTTKIMTTLTALNYGKLDNKIIISKRAASIGGSQVGYKENEEVSLRELLYGLMMRSGNDAAIAIAEGIAGNVEDFIEIMNMYAYSIGAYNSHFESPHGLDSANHYCTAYDLALITSKAKENSVFNQIVSSKGIDAEKYGFTRSYRNINKILYQIPESNGVKTGYTGNAGKCLVTSIKTQGSDLIIIVLNSNTRWKETRKIYDYVKENYEYKKVLSKGSVIDSLQIDSKNKINLLCYKDVIIPMKKNTEYYVETKKPQDIQRPIKKGNTMGFVYIYDNNKQLVYEDTLKCDRNVKELSIKEKIWEYFNFFNIINYTYN